MGQGSFRKVYRGMWSGALVAVKVCGGIMCCKCWPWDVFGVVGTIMSGRVWQCEL